MVGWKMVDERMVVGKEEMSVRRMQGRVARSFNFLEGWRCRRASDQPALLIMPRSPRTHQDDSSPHLNALIRGR